MIEVRPWRDRLVPLLRLWRTFRRLGISRRVTAQTCWRVLRWHPTQ